MALKDDIVGCYEFNETSGTTAVDSSANGNDGTIVGSISINQTGKMDKGYLFPASTTSYVSLAPGAKITGATPRTFSAWVKTDSLSDFATIVCLGDADWNKFFSFEVHIAQASSKYKLYIQKYGANWTTTAGYIPDGVWTFVFLTYDGIGTIYVGSVVDGTVSKESFSAGTIDTGGTNNPRLGLFTFAGSEPFDGVMDQVSLWSAVKSDDDLIAIENAGAGLEYADWDGGGGTTSFTPPVLWWS